MITIPHYYRKIPIFFMNKLQHGMSRNISNSNCQECFFKEKCDYKSDVIIMANISNDFSDIKVIGFSLRLIWIKLLTTTMDSKFPSLLFKISFFHDSSFLIAPYFYLLLHLLLLREQRLILLLTTVYWVLPAIVKIF